MHAHRQQPTRSPHQQGAAAASDPEYRRQRRNLSLTLAVTAVILVAEVAGGLLTGSLALLADAGHMLTDASAVGMSLLALRFAMRPADRRRTFGYYRVEILAALANGLVLIGLSTFLFMEAYERFAHPPAIDTVPMIGVATVGLVANVLGLWLLSGSRSNLNVKGAFLHILGDTISSVSVLVGGVVMLTTGYYRIDPILTVVIGIVILVSAMNLVREAVDVLLEAAPPHLELGAIARSMAEVAGVGAIHDLHVWTITSGMIAMSAHVVVSEGSAAVDNDRILRQVKRMLLDRYGIAHTTLQIESQVYEHVGPVH